MKVAETVGPGDFSHTLLEDGEWKHAFGQEEYDLFMPEATYAEFVAAQQ
jgi:hypothetical protein